MRLKGAYFTFTNSNGAPRFGIHHIWNGFISRSSSTLRGQKSFCLCNMRLLWCNRNKPFIDASFLYPQTFLIHSVWISRWNLPYIFIPEQQQVTWSLRFQQLLWSSALQVTKKAEGNIPKRSNMPSWVFEAGSSFRTEMKNKQRRRMKKRSEVSQR